MPEPDVEVQMSVYCKLSEEEYAAEYKDGETLSHDEVHALLDAVDVDKPFGPKEVDKLMGLDDPPSPYRIQELLTKLDAAEMRIEELSKAIITMAIVLGSWK